MPHSNKQRLKLTSCALLFALVSAGCQSGPSVRPVAVQENPPLEPPPAWMMEPAPEQSFTQRLLTLLSDSPETPTESEHN